MKIVQVCPAFAPYRGGVETHVEEISKRLAKAGLQVKVYCTDPTGKLPKKQTKDGFEIFRFRSFSPKHVYFFSPKLYHALAHEDDADVIHAHGYPNFPALAAATAKTSNKKPLVFTPHYGGYDVQTMGTGIWRIFAKKFYNLSAGQFILKSADAIVSVGKIEKDALETKFCIESEKIRYIPNGVNAQRFGNSPTKRDKKTVLYVGRLEKYKGVHFLLEAFKKVETTHKQVELVIVGSGPYKEELLTLARSLNFTNNVKFLENVPEETLTQLYLSSNVFVSLSQYEGQPITLVEAMCSGLPVVATSVGAVPELIQDHRTGFLLSFPPDEETLVRHISSLLENEEISKSMGARARESILSTFSWDRTVSGLIQLYEEVQKHGDNAR